MEERDFLQIFVFLLMATILELPILTILNTVLHIYWLEKKRPLAKTVRFKMLGFHLYYLILVFPAVTQEQRQSLLSYYDSINTMASTKVITFL